MATATLSSKGQITIPTVIRKVVWQAAKAARFGKADFADYLSSRINNSLGCSKTVTFDAAATENDIMELLK